MYQDRGLGIESFDVGVSTLGLESYISDLKLTLLENVLEMIDEVSSVNTALDAGWQGVSRDRFDEQFRRAREDLKTDLTREFADLQYKLIQMQQSYIEQDQNLIAIESIE